MEIPMKKIINGLRYDTDKAIEVGFYSNLGRGADSRSDFRWFEATLYKTPRSGRFFIAGTGGPMSRFSHSVGQNSWSGGSDLNPMTREEALEFAEQFLDAEEIEKHFAEHIEDA
jgi:hypothetical protein